VSEPGGGGNRFAEVAAEQLTAGGLKGAWVAGAGSGACGWQRGCGAEQGGGRRALSGELNGINEGARWAAPTPNTIAS